MNKSHYNPILMMIVTVLFGALISGQASAKSLYVIANINASPTPIQTYDIQPAPNYLVFQAEQGVPNLAGGAVGIALDADSAKLFLTYEFTNEMQLLDAVTFADLGTTTAQGASNLAGIVVHQAKSRVYAVDRFTNNLYVYDWDASTDTLTLVDGGGDNGNGEFDLALGTSAFGLSLDENQDRLYVGDGNNTVVRFYETTTFTETGNITLSHQSIDVAVDQTRNFLYSTGAFNNSTQLIKYDLNTDTETSTTIGLNITPTDFEGAVGVAIDETTGNVYVTTGFFDDWLLVLDSDLNVLTTFAKADIQAFGSGTNWGDPTGIVIPRVEIGFNPLGLSKTDDVDPVPSGSNVTYTVCYDNSDNTSDATNVTITDTIPAGTTFVSATGSPTVTATEVVWSIGTVLAGAAQACETVTFLVTAAPDSVITNSVTLTSDETGPSSLTETTDVGPAIIPPVFSKTDDMDSVPSGSDLTYTLCYDNSLNPLDVDNVTITDDIPAGTTFVDATGSFSTTPTTVTWSIGTVAAGAPEACVDLVVNVTAPGGDTIQNTATISGTILGTVIPVTATEDTEVEISEVVFKGEGEGGRGGTGPLELLFGLLCLPLILARRTGRRVNSLVMAGLLGALLTVTATSSVMAADSGWYAGAGIGSANTDVSSGDYDRKLAGLGYTASSDIDDTDTGWKLFGGFEFTENWAIEGAYVDLGDVTSDTVVSSGPPPEWTPQNFVDAAATVHPYSVDGIAITGIGTWPFGNGFSVFGKLGIFFWEADIKVECVGCVPGVKAPDDEDGTDITGGLGVGYDFANNFGVRAEWERFASDRDDVDLLSISVLYRF